MAPFAVITRRGRRTHAVLELTCQSGLIAKLAADTLLRREIVR